MTFPKAPKGVAMAMKMVLLWASLFVNMGVGNWC